MKNQAGSQAYKASRIYDGKSADERRKERCNLLLRTGIRLIGQQGYAAVSLNAICAEAGLTKRYFYESFESVDALLTQAFREISVELQRHVIQKIGDQKTPEAMITAGFRAFFEYIQAKPDHGRLYLVEALSVHGLRGDLFGSGGGAISPFLLATTLHFMDGLALPEPVLSIMAQGAVGAAIFVGQNWIASNYQQPIDELVQGVSEICFGIGQRLNISLDAGL